MSTLVVVLMLAAANTKPGLAVMPMASKTVAKDTVQVLDNLVVSAVSERGGYRVVSAADINAMLGLEKMKEALGCDDLSCAAEIGGALGVQYLVTSTVDKLGTDIVLTMSLLDIQKAEAVARKRAKVPNNENLYYDAIEKLVADTFGVAAEVVAEVTESAPGTSTGTGFAPSALNASLLAGVSTNGDFLYGLDVGLGLGARGQAGWDWGLEPAVAFTMYSHTVEEPNLDDGTIDETAILTRAMLRAVLSYGIGEQASLYGDVGAGLGVAFLSTDEIGTCVDGAEVGPQLGGRLGVAFRGEGPKPMELGLNAGVSAQLVGTCLASDRYIETELLPTFFVGLRGGLGL